MLARRRSPIPVLTTRGIFFVVVSEAIETAAIVVELSD